MSPGLYERLLTEASEMGMMPFAHVQSYKETEEKKRAERAERARIERENDPDRKLTGSGGAGNYRTVPCPVCGVARYEPCMEDGVHQLPVHAARMKKWEERNPAIAAAFHNEGPKDEGGWTQGLTASEALRKGLYPPDPADWGGHATEEQEKAVDDILANTRKKKWGGSDAPPSDDIPIPARIVACPHCNAGKGEPCVRRGGRKLDGGAFHKARERAALEELENDRARDS